jgi:hypothetical protein
MILNMLPPRGKQLLELICTYFGPPVRYVGQGRKHFHRTVGQRLVPAAETPGSFWLGHCNMFRKKEPRRIQGSPW